ncbi:hypothetical protein HU200_021814 [Digitaria exilis]|uniref:Reverse transcriptase zinc-binding domain-containing protein n=1 Tax=Digitaria exilis TaxID=1010633 RepID=A0A835EYX7_9POAL|nr:hypothetical protein HU200_021814 [Digitaria exilis]
MKPTSSYQNDIDMLNRKIVELPFCAAYGEHADQHHILLTCPRANEVWLLNRTTVPYLQSFRNLWDMPELPDGDQRLRSAVITVILWNIWKARNNLHFNKTITPAREVLHASLEDLQLWAKRMPSGTSTSVLSEFRHSVVI